MQETPRAVSLVPTVPFEPGQQVGRYRIVRLIAQGGMAEVYRAEQELAAGIFRPAALKVIRPEYSESPDFREMFLDEARTASTISHPNIVHIYDVGEEGGLLYMGMELVPGETLANVGRTLRQKDQRFSDEALLSIGIYTCSALEAVHALKLPGEGHLNLVHRDVSPHNLLLSSTGSLKLIDFGIAKAVTNRNLTMPGVTKGKAGYFSPEQAMGKALDGRSDLFSLGVTLYKLAYGATPFDDHKSHQSRNNALVRGQWLPLEQVCPGLPEGFYAVVRKALQVKPEDRFADAREMREALERVAVEMGMHVGQSSLIGYVSDSGEITASPSQKFAAVRLASGPTKPSTPKQVLPRDLATPPPPDSPERRHTERVMPKAGGERGLRVALLAGAALASVAVGALLAVLFASDEAPAVAPGAGVIAARVEPAQPETSPAEPPPEAEPEVAVSVAQPSIERRPPARQKERPQRKAVARAFEQEPERKPEPVAIPRGDGVLRVGTSPPENAQVLIGKESLGTVPVNIRKMKAGRYLLTITTATGKKGHCEAEVWPGRQNIYVYNFEQGICRRTQ